MARRNNTGLLAASESKRQQQDRALTLACSSLPIDGLRQTRLDLR
jgi:hypothetical protein